MDDLPASVALGGAAARQLAAARYRAVRAHTGALAAPLSAEDQALQSMPDASPAKWHQAHTSWFFEALLLRPCCRATRPLTSASSTSSTPITRPWARATRGPSAAC